MGLEAFLKTISKEIIKKIFFDEKKFPQIKGKKFPQKDFAEKCRTAILNLSENYNFHNALL